MSLRQPISEAPRNGRSLRVGDEGVGEFIMHWNADRTCWITGEFGVWEATNGSFTWTEHDNAGPTYFIDLPDYVEIAAAA